MAVTYREYIKASETVAKWDEQCAKVRNTRNQIDWKEHGKLKNIIWRKREELNKEMYLIRNATPNQIDDAGQEYLDEYINSLKLSLLKLRLRVMANCA